MVKGISRQVIVVESPDRKLFEQAIFILNNDAVGAEGITDELLLKEAKQIIGGRAGKTKKNSMACLFWSVLGAAFTGIIWILSNFL